MITKEQYSKVKDMQLNCRFCNFPLRKEYIKLARFLDYGILLECSSTAYNGANYIPGQYSEYISKYSDIENFPNNPYTEIFNFYYGDKGRTHITRQIYDNKTTCYFNIDYGLTISIDEDLIKNCESKEQIINKLRLYKTFM